MALTYEIESYAWHDVEDEWGDIDRHTQIPAGWRYLGSGAFRHAFQGPDGNVYKVLTKLSMSESESANKLSMERYIGMSGRAEEAGVKMALTNLINDVMIQEYIDSSKSNFDEVKNAYNLLKIHGMPFVDVSRDNLRIVDGNPVLIDW